MGFHENAVLPSDVSPGVQGGPGFSTNVISVDSGDRRYIRRHEEGVYRWNAGYSIRELSTLEAVIRFYLARDGIINGFRFFDWFDYTSTALGRLWGDDAPAAITDMDQVLGSGDGVATEFQLVKTYSDSGETYTRKILKPIAGTVVVSIDGVPQASGWTVDTTTGIVTITIPPPGGDTVRAGYQFHAPVNFAPGIDERFEVIIETFASGSIVNIPVEEIVDPSPANEQVCNGGAVQSSFDSNKNLHQKQRLWSLDPTAGGLKAFLPDVANVELGGPILALENTNGSNTIDIRDSDDTTTIKTLATTSDVFEFWLTLDSSDVKQWVVF